MPASKLEQLWRLAQRQGETQGIKPEYAFDSLGLILHYPPSADSDHKYDCTPLNASVFGSTGGDGVHFSLLHQDGQVSDDSPVIMTVPALYGGPKNWVLGADLTEFLALGCQLGFYRLEYIAFERSTYPDFGVRQPVTFADFQPVEPDYQPGLDLIAQEFDLKLWPSLLPRLDELESRYLHLIQSGDTENYD